MGSAAPPTQVSRFNLWYAGILTFLVGTLFQAYGANLQRWSKENESEESTSRHCWQRPHAVWGLVLFASGGIVCSISLIFASESLMAPLVLLLFVFNPIFAYYMNNEPFDWATDGVCTLFVMAGVGLVEGFSPHDSASYSVAHIEWLFQQSSCIGFFSVVLGMIGITYWQQRRIIKKISLGDDGYPEPGKWSCESGFLSVSYGALAGATGGINVTLTKILFSVLVDVDYEAREVFRSYVLYLTCVTMLLSYIMELQLTAHGLEQVGSMIFLPAFAVIEQIVISMGAMLFFEDYAYFTTFAATMFAFGNGIALIAVVIMAYLRLRTHGDASDVMRKQQLNKLPMPEPMSSDGLCGPLEDGSGKKCCGC